MASIVYVNKPAGSVALVSATRPHEHDRVQTSRSRVLIRTTRPMGDDLDIEGRRADGSSFPVDVQLNALPGSALVVADGA